METELAKLEINCGESHSVIVDKKTGKTIQDLGRTGEKAPNVNVNANAGSWQLQEDASGKPVLFNTKSGETKAAPEGMQKSGTFSKNQAAEQKELGGIDTDLAYAHNYLQDPKKSGAGDLIIQDKFFDMAKPSTGFRMTDAQQKKLADSKDWATSGKGIAYRALTGRWYPPQQLEEIVHAMDEIGKAKKEAWATSHGSGGADSSGGALKRLMPDKYFGEGLNKAKRVQVSNECWNAIPTFLEFKKHDPEFRADFGKVVPSQQPQESRHSNAKASRSKNDSFREAVPRSRQPIRNLTIPRWA